jgi:ParB family chromosome partitioning protein
MATRRNALGRGLGALIPQRPEPTRETPARDDASASARSAEPTPERVDRETAPRQVPVSRIAPNPQQPRREFDDDEIARLARSIQQHGVLQPVVVRRTAGSEAPGGERFELVVGERRWRASLRAGLETIPVVVADVADRELLEVALVENVQRQDLNAIELALAFKTMSEAGATQEEIGRRVGLDRSSVANHVRLLELPREMQQDVESGRLSFGHAKALLGLSNPERRRHLRRRILDDGLSVRETERLARSAAGVPGGRKKTATASIVDPEQQRVLDLLRERLKTRVKIVGGPGRGRIEIEYFGSEDLGRIASAILDG